MERLTTGSILFDGYTLKGLCVFDSSSEIQDEEKSCYEQCDETFYENSCEECQIKEAFDRLAAYEDTGLTPKEVEALKADNDRIHRLIDELEIGLRKDN